jgi:hypothetical protein
MAQTIATVRGTTTANYNSQTTLFTQSGGNSTRVILNQLTWYYPSDPATNQRIHLLHVSSSGPITVIGYYLGYIGLSGQMMPNPNGTSPTQSIGIGSSYGIANGVIAYNNNVANWVGSGQPSYWTLSTNGSSYMPQNYWIGPGDSIAVVQYNTPYGYSATVGYHFTTITES